MSNQPERGHRVPPHRVRLSAPGREPSALDKERQILAACEGNLLLLQDRIQREDTSNPFTDLGNRENWHRYIRLASPLVNHIALPETPGEDEQYERPFYFTLSFRGAGNGGGQRSEMLFTMPYLPRDDVHWQDDVGSNLMLYYMVYPREYFGAASSPPIASLSAMFLGKQVRDYTVVLDVCDRCWTAEADVDKRRESGCRRWPVHSVGLHERDTSVVDDERNGNDPSAVEMTDPEVMAERFLLLPCCRHLRFRPDDDRRLEGIAKKAEQRLQDVARSLQEGIPYADESAWEAAAQAFLAEAEVQRILLMESKSPHEPCQGRGADKWLKCLRWHSRVGGALFLDRHLASDLHGKGLLKRRIALFARGVADDVEHFRWWRLDAIPWTELQEFLATTGGYSEEHGLLKELGDRADELLKTVAKTWLPDWGWGPTVLAGIRQSADDPNTERVETYEDLELDAPGIEALAEILGLEDLRAQLPEVLRQLASYVLAVRYIFREEEKRLASDGDGLRFILKWPAFVGADPVGGYFAAVALRAAEANQDPSTSLRLPRHLPLARLATALLMSQAVIAVEQARRYREGVATAYAHTAHELQRHLDLLLRDVNTDVNQRRRVQYCRFLVLGMSTRGAQVSVYREERVRNTHLRELVCDWLLDVVRQAAAGDALKDATQEQIERIESMVVDTAGIDSGIELPEPPVNAQDDVGTRRMNAALAALLALGAYLLDAFGEAARVQARVRSDSTSGIACSDICLSAHREGGWVEFTCSNWTFAGNARIALERVTKAAERRDLYPEAVHSYDYVAWVLHQALSPPPNAEYVHHIGDRNKGWGRFTLRFKVPLYL